MESKESIVFKENYNCISELRKTYDYVDRFSTYATFPELKNPVMDSEGLIREEDEPNVTKSLYDPERNVTVIHSTDLKKIQTDIKRLEVSYCKKKIKVSDLKNILMEQNAKWEQQASRWEEHSKNTDLMIAKLEGAIETQNQRIKNFMDTIEEKDAKIREIENENKALKEELSNKNRMDEIEIMDEIALAWKKPNHLPPLAKWRDRNTLLGVKHTFFDTEYPREKQENDFRICAYEGNLAGLQQLLSNDKTLINGRGMPDSFGSTIRSWMDKTPLMLAAQKGRKACVKFLLDNGAYLNCLDRDKLTALDYAEANNHQDIAVFLKTRGAENGRYLKDIFESRTQNSRDENKAHRS